MHPFGLIHDMNCIETFFLKKRKTSKGQSDISAFSNNQQRCSQSKIPSPTSWMGLEEGKDKPQLETRFRTKSRAIRITWAGRDPSHCTVHEMHCTLQSIPRQGLCRLQGRGWQSLLAVWHLPHPTNRPSPPLGLGHPVKTRGEKSFSQLPVAGAGCSKRLLYRASPHGQRSSSSCKPSVRESRVFTV